MAKRIIMFINEEMLRVLGPDESGILICLSCSSEIEETARYCQNSGGSMAKACPGCGSMVEKKLKHCTNYGSGLDPDMNDSGNLCAKPDESKPQQYAADMGTGH